MDKHRITATRGLPGSGKTTWARSQAGAWLVGRDHLRRLHTTPWPFHSLEERLPLEGQISAMQIALISSLIQGASAQGNFVHIIVDDTNLDPAHLERLQALAAFTPHFLEFALQDFTDVPLAVCIQRDALRDETSGHVGELVIRGLFMQWLEPEGYSPS